MRWDKCNDVRQINSLASCQPKIDADQLQPTTERILLEQNIIMVRHAWRAIGETSLSELGADHEQYIYIYIYFALMIESFWIVAWRAF